MGTYQFVSTDKQTNQLYTPASLYTAHVYYLLARSPDDPQRIRVASVFELFFDCSLLVGKFSNSSPHPPLL